MRAVIQRVSSASVMVEEEKIAEIKQGMLVLLGIFDDDSEEDLRYICEKVATLRIFDDADGVANFSVEQIKAEVLLVSQFTLCADARHGRRPSYFHAASAEAALPLYQNAQRILCERGIPVKTGKFQAEMKVSLVNDGPMTILLDSRRTF